MVFKRTTERNCLGKDFHFIPYNRDCFSCYLNIKFELICNRLKEKGIRVHVDNRNEKLGYRLREAQISKVPYQLVIGDNEIENKTLNVRRYGQEETNTYDIDEFIEVLINEIKNKGN